MKPSLTISSIRYESEIPTYEVLDQTSLHNIGITKRSLLSHGININETLLPGPFRALSSCAKILGIEMDRIEGYVYSYPDNNAFCMGKDSDHIVFALSSSLIQNLRSRELRFIIGHELGHSVLGHSDSIHFSGEKADYEQRKRLREQEISADRCGLLCCQSLQSSIAAVMKVASGLDEKSLNIDIAAFINQCNKLESLPVGIGDQYSTHPPLPLRARALTWFSLSGILETIRSDAPFDINGIKTANRQISSDMSQYLDRQMEENFESSKSFFRMVFFTHQFCKDGKLTKKEQKFLIEKCGDDATRLMSLIAGLSRDEVSHVLVNKARSALLDMEAYSRSESQEFKNSCATEMGISDQALLQYS